MISKQFPFNKHDVIAAGLDGSLYDFEIRKSNIPNAGNQCLIYRCGSVTNGQFATA